MLRHIPNRYKSLAAFSWRPNCHVAPTSIRHYCNNSEEGEYPKRFNHVGIQMLSPNVHSHVFGEKCKEDLSPSELDKIKDHLEQHQLWDKETSIAPEVLFDLPQMQGKNIEEHFKVIAERINEPYNKLTRSLLSAPILKRPKKWSDKPGI